MFQFILPIFFILASIGLFFGFTKAKWDSIQSLRSETVEYKKALDNSKQLLTKRDELLNKKNSISESDIEKLNVLLPNDVNSTKVILEIENLATRIHGLGFENPKYDPNKKVVTDTKTTTTDKQTPKDLAEDQKDYGTFELEFTLSGPYDRFIGFVQDLEKSLRIIDIQSVEISTPDNQTMKYLVKVQTYWLKS